jgi:membrane protease YdiL (CAAX protease family)
VDEQTPIESPPLQAPSAIQIASPSVPPPASDVADQPAETDARRSPTTAWRPWTALLALIGGLVLAAIGGLIVDLPASLFFGVKLSASHTPPGLIIADTAVQDLAFVLVAVYCAQLGARAVRSWQFGLRRPGIGWSSTTGFIVLLLAVFIVGSVIWSGVFHPKEEELLKTLGSNEGTALLLASAVLTCVVAPICEEMLFRGYIFTALRNWKGTLPAALITAILFGGVHAGSAPALDLVPLAGLGFGLCLLYRYTGSLYPCIIAHSLNNSLAFSSLESWSWQTPVLMGTSLLAVGALAALFKRVGLISPVRGFTRVEA